MQARDYENGTGFSPADVLGIVRKRLWVVVATAVFFAASAVAFGLLQTPEYDASAKMLVGQEPVKDSDRVGSLGSDIQGLQQATQTVAVAVGSEPVAQMVVNDLDLQADPEALVENLSVQQLQATQFVELTYSDADPERARQVVNGVADAASSKIADSSAGASGIEASVWEYASVPEAPSGLDPLRIGILALGLGLMLGAGFTFLLEHLDDALGSPEEVEAFSGVPNFSTVPEFASSARKG